MTLLDRIIPKTTFPKDKAVIEGTIVRFGLALANEHRNHFSFRLEGRDEVFEIILVQTMAAVGSACQPSVPGMTGVCRAGEGGLPARAPRPAG